MTRNSFHHHVTRRNFLTGSSLVLTSAFLGATLPLVARQAPATAGAADPSLIEDLIVSNRILYQEGINDAFGHVSARHNRNPNRFLLSRSRAPELVTANDLIEYDLDGNPVDLKGVDPRDQYSERYIHAAIYKVRPDVNAIVHNHSEDIIPFTVSSIRLRPVFHVAAFLGEPIPIFEMREAFGMTHLLVNDAARGAALAKSLGTTASLVLMRGHGVTIVGPSLPYAVGRSVYTGFNARLQMQAINLGGSVTYIDPQEAKAQLANGESRGYERPWEAWKRKALAK